MNRISEADPSLEGLMRRAQKGDKQAYAALFTAIAPLLRSFVSRRLSDRADVDDVVQDILLSIHRASHTYDTDRPFKVWMFTIARYRLTDHLRQLYRRGAHPEVSIDAMIHEIPADDVTKQQESSEYLSWVMSDLPEKQKRIVTMMKIEGYSARDTAAALDMSVAAVKVAAHRAYKRLALKIEQEEE